MWDLLGDVTRMPEWSEELESVELLEGDGRSAGSRFRGKNRSGDRSTRWWYRVEPSGDGAVVSEGSLRVAKLGRVRALAERKLLGDRAEYNARNIDASLRRLAEALES